MKEYLEKEKIEARKSALETAIKYLTIERNQSTLASIDYVQKVKNHLIKYGTKYDIEFAKKLSDKNIQYWENFYSSIVTNKTAKQLKVAYLCGPNPENDINEFVKYGLLPENIWGFESDEFLYDKAVISTLSSKYPFIKLHKGNISNFFKYSPLKFDIIYLDFCATLPKSISTLTSLFHYHVLNSPGILITNFSFPEKNKFRDKRGFIDNRGWKNIVSLSASYLYPKPFMENIDAEDDDDNYDNCSESASALGYSCNDFLNFAFQNDTFIYSQFITRVIHDLASFIVPYYNFASNKYFLDIFFCDYNKKLPQDFYESLIEGSPEEYPILFSFSPFNLSNEFCNFHKHFYERLSINSDAEDLKNKLELMYCLIVDTPKNLYNKKLKQLSERYKDWHTKTHQFCDPFTFHHLQDLLIRQLCIPYDYNTERNKRWTYKAKQTRMFMDLFLFDECRYVYDWLPTLDMLEKGLEKIQRQLIYRFALDALSKHRRWYNSEFFYGTAVTDGFEFEDFTFKYLKPRIKIN